MKRLNKKTLSDIWKLICDPSREKVAYLNFTLGLFSRSKAWNGKILLECEWNFSFTPWTRREKSHGQSENFSRREKFTPWNLILERKNDSVVFANVNVISLQKHATSNLTIKSWRKRDTKLNSKKKKGSNNQNFYLSDSAWNRCTYLYQMSDFWYL